MEPDAFASLVPLDPAAARPLTAQIYDALRRAAREGKIGQERDRARREQKLRL